MPASKEQLWKPEEDQIIRDLVKNQYRIMDMGIFLPNRTQRALYCRIYELGLKSGSPRTKYSKNETFWEIPNAINCYYAGWIAADGSIDNEKHTLRLSCEKSDEPSLYRFMKESEYDGKIFNTLKKSPSSDYISIHSTLAIGACQKWNEDLKRVFNLFQNKTYRLAPPNLGNDYLMCCYLAGLLDGDGALSSAQSTQMIHIAYGSASRLIVEWVQKFVDEKFPFRAKNNERAIVKNKLDGRYFHYSIYGVKAAKLIELFRTLPIPRFVRKWDNPTLLTLIDSYHKRFPSFFTSDQQLAFDSSGKIVFANTLSTPSPPTPI